MKISAEKLTWFGRYLDNEGIRYFNYSSSGFCFVFKGKRAFTTIISDADDWEDVNKGVLGVYISEGDDCSWESFPEEPDFKITLNKKVNDCLLFESSVEKTVCIRVIKLSEAAFGFAGFKQLEIDGEILPSKLPPAQKIEYIGDSITCGYGVEGVWGKDVFTTQQERADKSYAFLTAKNLKAQFQCCSWSGIGITSNYVDPATINLPDTHWLMPAVWPYTDKSLSLRLGLEPEIWDESRFSPDLVVINLGTNDISWVRGLEERRLAYVSGLRQLIEAVHRRSPKAKICCCIGIMGSELNESVREAVSLFNQDFPKVPAKVVLFPVQDEKDGIGADWHPTAKTHQKAAEILAKEINNWE